MTEQNPYTYALTADPDKPLREAREEIKRLWRENDALRAERDDAVRKLAEAKTRMVRLLSQMQELEAREQ